MVTHATPPLDEELPPRTRRILSFWGHPDAVHGTTSAYAENTTIIGDAAPGVVNYLRVRGEYGHHLHPALICRELPPRTRRIPPASPGPQFPLGTTSAYAENT